MLPGPSFGKAPSAWRLATARSFGGSAKKKNPDPGGPMVQLRHSQQNLGEVFFAREAESLMEAWMKEADEILEDEQLLDLVYEQLGRRYPQSRKRGRNSTPAEVVLRLMVLKHVRNWSYDALEREVKANLVYRMFTRIGTKTVPDSKTLGKLGRTLGSKIVEQIHQRLVDIARQRHMVEGRRMRIDTTVTEVNIHYPTDSSLLGDGTRVLTRIMKQISDLVGEQGTRLRDRLRTIGHRVMEIARLSRSKGQEQKTKMQEKYRELVRLARQVRNQAQRFSEEIHSGVKRAVNQKQQAVLQGMKQELDTTIPLVNQVLRQTTARVFRGVTDTPGKIVSVFEPKAEIIRKGKVSKPTEFGKLVKIQEAENQIITHYAVCRQRPADSTLLLEAVRLHQQRLGRSPELLAGDAGFYSAENEREAHALGVQRVSIPNRSTQSAARRKHQKKRWFRKGQKWRTGCEGRISVLKRRHGLNRSRYRGEEGMERWVGFGVVADTLINMGRVLASWRSG
jgi:transposase, IS5 family